MYRIAIVDDQEADAKRLMLALNRFSSERGIEFTCIWYPDAVEFLDKYQMQYHIVFLDIDMPGMNGMNAARKLRKIDSSVILIFMTVLSQFAVQGYEVDAMAYILKPVTWAVINLHMQKAITRCKSNDDQTIIVNAEGEKKRISIQDLIYIEVFEHHIQYRTTKEKINSYGSLREVEKKLTSHDFFRINKQVIINLTHIKKVSGSSVFVQDRSFPISRIWKKDFLSAFHRYGLT